MGVKNIAFVLRKGAALAVLALTGCIHLPEMGSRPLRPLPETLASAVSSPSTACVISEHTLSEDGVRKIVEVSLESPSSGTNKVLTLDCYIPRGAANLPAIIILPISAGNRYQLERGHIAPYFADRAVVILMHREDNFNATSKAQIDTMLRQSVIDEKVVLNWIATRPECDPKRIGVIGTSMGAIKGSLLVAADDRIKAAVLILTGENLPYILAHTKDGRLRHGVYRIEWMSILPNTT